MPAALLITGYVAYVDRKKAGEIISKLVLSFIIYGATTFVTGWFMFLLIFAGAHTDPVGQALSWQGKFIYSAIVLSYAALSWLLCSLVNGGLIKPWEIFQFNSNKTQSIFGAK